MEENAAQNSNNDAKTDATKLPAPIFSCYGCGAPGVYRSNCPKCSGRPKESPQPLAFNKVSTTIIGRDIPVVHINVMGLKGEACFDTGAKTSVASAHLKKLLTSKGVVFQNVQAEVLLADGHICAKMVMSAIIDVGIGGRIRKMRLISLPNAKENRTLIATDFLEQAGNVLNMAQRLWYFEDEPKVKHPFETPSKSLLAMDVAGKHIV